MFQTRERKTNLVLLFHPCTWFPSEDACCRHTGAVYIFIHIYLLKWAALCLFKGEFSQYQEWVYAFIFTYSQTPLEKKAAFLFKNRQVYRTSKHCHESHGREHRVQTAGQSTCNPQNNYMCHDMRNTVILMYRDKVNFKFFTQQSTKMYHSNTMFFGHVPW